MGCHFIYVALQFDFIQVQREDFLPIFSLGQFKSYFTIKSSGTQECFVQHIQSVCCTKNQHLIIFLKPIQFNKESIQRIFFFVVPHSCAGCAGARQGINLIDKNNARRFLSCLLEQIAYPRCTDADEHL